MSYAEDQAAWLKETGVKGKDIVRVALQASSFQSGWPCVWRDDMDDCVGRNFEVQHINDLGVRLEVGHSWQYFPFFVLIKVEGDKNGRDNRDS